LLVKVKINLSLYILWRYI